jgi:hypothetical protein
MSDCVRVYISMMAHIGSTVVTLTLVDSTSIAPTVHLFHRKINWRRIQTTTNGFVITSKILHFI